MRKHLALLVIVLTALLATPTFAASPTITCSGDQTLECTNAVGAIEATVQDADGDALMVIWALNGQPVQTNVLAAGSTTNAITLSLTNEFGFGTNDISVGVTDDGTNVVMCSSTIVVQDTSPPVITKLLATPNVLWPPNHKLVCIRLCVKAEDSCGGSTSWRITSVTSNEGDDSSTCKNTSPDWIIKDDHKVLLRAERSGRGSGRDYTITVEASDDSGNVTSGEVHVLVPHDKGNKKWHEDGDDDDDDDDQGSSKGKDKGKDKGNGKSKGKGKGHD